MGKHSRSNKLALEQDFGDVDEDAQAAKLFAEKQQKKKKRARTVEAGDDDPEVDESDADNDVAAANVRPPTQPPKRQKLSKKSASNEDSESGDGQHRYERYSLFVGQIPFDATADDISQHFADHGAGKVKVRLLTDKKSGGSRGMAFVDFESPQHLVRGLRVHHTRLKGRAINVERTVGGGGNNPVRKQKLKELREFQGSRVRREVLALVEDAIAASKGILTTETVDDLVVESLCALPRDAAKQVLEEVLESDIARARNKKAWILGCIKRYTNRLKTGEQFLKLEEEKAGIVEKKRPQKPKDVGLRKSKPTADEKLPPVVSKFKRGQIGGS